MTIKELCTKVREAAEAMRAGKGQYLARDYSIRARQYRDLMDDPETPLALLGRIEELEKALEPFAAAYRKHDDPGVSDLYDEQPVAWHVELGAYRAARRLIR